MISPKQEFDNFVKDMDFLLKPASSKPKRPHRGVNNGLPRTLAPVRSRLKIPASAAPLVRFFRRAWGFLPLSWPGLLLVITVLLGTYYFGIKEDDEVLLITGVVLLAAALIDATIVILTACYLGAYFNGESRKAVGSGRRLKMMTGVQTLSGRKLSPLLPPLIEASTSILVPEDLDCEWKRNGYKEREEWLTATRRCLLEENFRLLRRVIVKDVLGFCSLDWEQEEPISLVVMPKPLPLQSQSLIRSRFTGDDTPDPRGEPKGDRVDMRRYSPGDPPRMLLWKVYARTGKLMVRVPEAAITTAPRTCAYLVAGPEDEALASVARTVVEASLLGQGWWFGADGSERSVDKKEQALQLIARSGNPGVQTGQGLSAFLKKASGEGFGSCLVFVPPTDGEWVEKVAASISRSPIAVTLLTVGSAAPQEQQPNWRRWVFYNETRKTDPSELLARLNSSMVTDWLTFEPDTQRLIPLRVGSQGAQ